MRMVLAHVRDIAVDRIRRRVHLMLSGHQHPCHVGLSITAPSTLTCRAAGMLRRPSGIARSRGWILLAGQACCRCASARCSGHLGEWAAAGRHAGEPAWAAWSGCLPGGVGADLAARLGRASHWGTALKGRTVNEDQHRADPDHAYRQPAPAGGPGGPPRSGRGPGGTGDGRSPAWRRASISSMTARSASPATPRT